MGSMNKFPKGNVYERCRRGHVLLSAVIHGLYLENFFVDPESDRFKHLIEKYVTCMEETMAGYHGKTAQFWINCIYLMDMYYSVAML